MVGAESDFKTHLEKFVPLLLSKEYLKVKKICGNPVTGKDLLTFLEVRVCIIFHGWVAMNIPLGKFIVGSRGRYRNWPKGGHIPPSPTPRHICLTMFVRLCLRVHSRA